ncbi:hypothetical protein [Streptomyces sp. NPDC054783]
MVREKLRTTVAAQDQAYDVIAHQQAAMPEQLLAPPAADPEHGDQEPETGPREAIDLTALQVLRESRTDVEALDPTAERLRHLQDVFTKAADDSRARVERYADRDDADAVHPVREGDQRAHSPQQPGPHRGRGAATECTRCRVPDAAVRTGDARHPVHRALEGVGVETTSARRVRGACGPDGRRRPWSGRQPRR